MTHLNSDDIGPDAGLLPGLVTAPHDWVGGEEDEQAPRYHPSIVEHHSPQRVQVLGRRPESRAGVSRMYRGYEHKTRQKLLSN